MADHLDGTLSRMKGCGRTGVPLTAANTSQPGMRQILATRPDLVDELRNMGWIPPAEAASAAIPDSQWTRALAYQPPPRDLSLPLPDAIGSEDDMPHQWDLSSALSQARLPEPRQQAISDPVELVCSARKALCQGDTHRSSGQNGIPYRGRCPLQLLRDSQMTVLGDRMRPGW